MIKCYLVNHSKYSLTQQGIVNGDVVGNGNGLNTQDAIAVQKFILKILTSLPA